MGGMARRARTSKASRATTSKDSRDLSRLVGRSGLLVLERVNTETVLAATTFLLQLARGPFSRACDACSVGWYVYCRDALGLTDAEAFNRIEVARTGRRFPVIFEMLLAGALHLTSVKLLAPHLTPDNHEAVLESARGKTKAEIELIIAALSPRPDVATSFRKLPRNGGDTEVPGEPGSPDAPAPPPAVPDGTHAVGDAAVSAPPLASILIAAPAAVDRPVTPLSPDRYKLQVTITGETLEKLRLATDMLGQSRRATRRPYSIGPSPRCSRSSRSRNSPTRASRGRPNPRKLRSQAAVPSPPRSGARCGCGIADAAPLSARRAIAATSAASSNSITSTRTRSAARRAST
jgi:hypothetical protein